MTHRASAPESAATSDRARERAVARHRRRALAAAVTAAVLVLFTVGAGAAQAWHLTIDIYGSGTVDEQQNPAAIRQHCGSLQATTGQNDLQTHCVSGDIYCGLCNYTIVASPADGFSFSRYQWVHPPDITWSGTTSSWTWAAGPGAGDFEVRAFFVDTSPPDTTISGGPPEGSFTNSRSAGFSFSTTQPFGAGSYLCTLNATPIACANPFTLTSLPEGLQTLSVQAEDPSGNIDPSPATRSWTVDTTPPLTTLSGGPLNSSRTNNRSATFSVAVNEPATLSCSLNGLTIACAPGPLQLTNLQDGSYSLSLRATDRAGNREASPVTRTWTVDTSPPTTSLTGGPANGDLVNSSTAAFTISVNEPATVDCSLDGADIPCAPGAFSVFGLGDGQHTLTARATDLAGNRDPGQASRTWTVDVTPPDTVITTGPPEGARTSARTAMFTFTGAGDGGHYECRVDGGPFAACTGPASDFIANLGLGLHSFEVRAIDPAGNVDGSPASRSWTVVPADAGQIFITSTVSWSEVTRKGVDLTRVTVTHAPKGARVEVSCGARKRCRFAQTRTASGRRLTLKRFSGKWLAPGETFVIAVTKPGMIGDYVIQRANRPGAGRAGLRKFIKDPITVITRCIPAGTTTPQKQCPAVGSS
jgi:hypothetical protein